MMRSFPVYAVRLAVLVLGTGLIALPEAESQTQTSPAPGNVQAASPAGYPAAGPVGYPAAGPASPKVPLFSGPDARLNPKEQKGVSFGRDWAGNRDMPARGEAGSTVFVFG